MDIQFYPTPENLAKLAWAKFKNRDFVRVLEPSAGEGHLLAARPEQDHWRRELDIDCIEIDMSKHPLLRDKGYDVIGLDFLSFDGAGATYSHILMNPPFAQGAQHVLKAWELLYDGEVVAILNAETIHNPFSKERELLVRLIEQHGEVEFIEGAFSVEEAERKTDVDVALVYLRKKAPFYQDLMGDILDHLKVDERADSLADGFEQKSEVTIPASYIENAVKNFNAAVEAMRQSVFAEARAQLYTARVGKSMEEMNGGEVEQKCDSHMEFVRRELHKRYRDLKNRAWTGIVRSTEVMSKLSSGAQKRLESEFENIKRLEFTTSNVYGFLLGLIEKRGDMQIQMCLDIFDELTRWHTDNTVFYRGWGWKSNDKHRRNGIRLKTSRIVLPNHKTESYRDSLGWDSMRFMADMDKAFALLDSKLMPDYGLREVFSTRLKELRAGARVSSSYFDVRYYPGKGTVHLFPRDKVLVDRLNRLVGRQRQWLPPEGERVSKDFWLAFDQAEKFDKEFREEAQKAAGNRWWDNPLSNLHMQDDRGDLAHAKLGEAIETVLRKHGIDPVAMLEPPKDETPALPLLAA